VQLCVMSVMLDLHSDRRVCVFVISASDVTTLWSFINQFIIGLRIPSGLLNDVLADELECRSDDLRSDLHQSRADYTADRSAANTGPAACCYRVVSGHNPVVFFSGVPYLQLFLRVG